MKGIYTAILFFGILVIFSVQAFAQNGAQISYQTGTGNGNTKNMSKGKTNGSEIGYADSSTKVDSDGSTGNAVKTEFAPAPKKGGGRRFTAVVEPVENYREKYDAVYTRTGEPDRFGYNPHANSIARICLVAGARRCVQ